MRAYIEGYLNPAETNAYDHKWLTKASWILNWVESRNWNEIRKLRHDLNCAVLTYELPEAMEKHWGIAQELQNKIQKSLMPWAKIDTDTSVQGTFKTFKAMWEAKWGKLDDPKTQERIKWTESALRKNISGQRS